MQDSHDFHPRAFHDTVKNDMSVRFYTVKAVGNFIILAAE